MPGRLINRKRGAMFYAIEKNKRKRDSICTSDRQKPKDSSKKGNEEMSRGREKEPAVRKRKTKKVGTWRHGPC
ncbi:hypothetical protein BDV06DRAFT_205263 [Aspergillus oleicola]